MTQRNFSVHINKCFYYYTNSYYKRAGAWLCICACNTCTLYMFQMPLNDLHSNNTRRSHCRWFANITKARVECKDIRLFLSMYYSASKLASSISCKIAFDLSLVVDQHFISIFVDGRYHLCLFPYLLAAVILHDRGSTNCRIGWCQSILYCKCRECPTVCVWYAYSPCIRKWLRTSAMRMYLCRL